MSYLLFMDESGHDHTNTPFEVRGGIALHARRLWPFIRAMTTLEEATFGDLLHGYGSEIKGAKLLDKTRFRWAVQADRQDDLARRKNCVAFLNKGLQRRPPNRAEFTAYGQACLAMVDGLFELLAAHDAVLFAAMIPRGVKPTGGERSEGHLRKDQVFLLERYYYFLQSKRDQGLLVMDETDKALDRRFVRQMHNYFALTQNGRLRTEWIVPSPFFVSSDMTYPVQAADLCLYCINWGFRLPRMGQPQTRDEIKDRYMPRLKALEFRGLADDGGTDVPTYGIVHVPDPYSPRT